MRLYILLYFGVLITDTTSGQRQWGNYEGNIGGEIYSVLIECKDTMINGVTWRQLQKYSWNYNVMEPGDPVNRGYVRTESGKEYWLNLNEEILLYDMTLSVGDTIELDGIPRNRVFEVMEVDSIKVFGEGRRRQIMRHVEFNYLDYWVEGIGSTKNHYLWPGEEDGILDGGSWSVCYTEKDKTGVWRMEEDTLECEMEKYEFDCRETTGTANVYEQFEIFPNPWTGGPISVKRNDEIESVKVKIYSTNGQMVYEGRLNELHHSQIKRGHYGVVSTTSEQRKVYRLIVE